MAQTLLHGTLHATIYEVDQLHHGGAPSFFRKIVANIEETVGLGNGVSKLYATIDLGKARVGRTRIIEKEPSNPCWYESFHIYCAHMASDVVFTIKDDNPIGATLIGRAYIAVVDELLGEEEQDRWVEIMDEDRNPIGSKIHVKLQYFAVSKDRNYSRGIRSAKLPGVPDTFFSQRQGCKESLYQDAHVPDNFIPKIPLAGGKYYDLCDGRYDTPFHSLFRTLDMAHHDDFHQPNFAGASITKGGPREPWHDIHSRLEGPIAWDVLYNFEQRWRKQGGKDLLLPLRELDVVIIPPSPVMFPDDPERWQVQLFRSIDGGAAFGFPKTPEDAARAGLISGKDNIIDRSIQDAYINAIRRAKNFIYIENQYFLGSSFAWSADGIKPEDINALHLMPKELSLKIVSKIEAGERFSVYVVVPMLPEGVPESASVRAILDWQKRTMEMMYKDVVQALQAKGIEEDPRNYLTFFCLGNQEVKRSGEYEPSEKPEPDGKTIYVHAKMMIVDDEYMIIGSANINRRSMDGAGDSEIAMGAYQPHHLATREPARGQIHGFRMALWYKHLGMLDDSFLQPEGEESIRKVNQIADKYWDLYLSETLERDLPGHLLRYPIGVASDRVITELPGFKHFPDTKARILGTKSDYMPPILAT